MSLTKHGTETCICERAGYPLLAALADRLGLDEASDAPAFRSPFSDYGE
jgi:hypothetical protein